MAVRKKATKTSKKAESGISVSDIEVSSKTKKNAEKALIEIQSGKSLYRLF